MKTLLTLILIALLFSCLQKARKNDVEFISSSRNDITDDTTIFGNWALCAIGNDTQITQFNLCSKINFEKDGKGKINNIESFNWTLKKSNLQITNFLAPSNAIFGTGEYFTNFMKENATTTLVVS